MAFGVDQYPEPPEPRTWHYDYDRVDGEIVRTRINDEEEEEDDDH